MNNYTKLQLEAFNSMLNGENIFLTGPGGTGKTYILNEFINYYKTNISNNNNELIVTSTTGCSASLLNGVTINSWGSIGLGNEFVDYYIDNILKFKEKKNKWLNVKILIIDEISMLSPELFEKLNIIAKKIRKNNKIFGGIQIILSGDFCQLPNINSKYFCFESFIWNKVINKTYYFKEILRQNDNKFMNILNEIRLGNISEKNKKILNTRLCKKLIIDENGILPTILYSKKIDVNNYNEKKLLELINNGNLHNNFNCEYIYPKNQSEYHNEILKNYIDKNNNIFNNIILSINSQIMITKNYKLDDGTQLFNGQRGVVIDFDKSTNLPIIKFRNGLIRKIDYFDWTFELNDSTKITKKQLPIILAWAITIHKAQGLTLDYVFTDVGDSIFEYGQTYVVLSRVKSLDSLFIKNINYEKIKTHHKVINYYQSLN